MGAKIVAILFLVFTTTGLTAGEKPVMLFLSESDQTDTLGYNLVSALPALMYTEIMEGRIPLWDSPEKQVKILPASLKAIEESNKLSFPSSHQLFILEKWNFEKRNLKFEISGFYFSDRSSTAEVSYGFVDYRDAELALTSAAISANANGSCFQTFKYIILNHLYFYSIVQFGNKRIGSLEESQKIKGEMAPLLSTNTKPSSATKKIIYLIEKPAAESVTLASGAATYQVLKLLEDYLNQHKEVYLNLGGDKISDFMSAEPIKVSSLESEEIWTKNDTGFDAQLLSLTIHLNLGTLNPLTIEDLFKLDIRSGEAILSDLLKQKEFYFRILSINSEKIPEYEAAKYLKALNKFSWNQVKEYVKYD